MTKFDADVGDTCISCLIIINVVLQLLTNVPRDSTAAPYTYMCPRAPVSRLFRKQILSRTGSYGTPTGCLQLEDNDPQDRESSRTEENKFK